MKICIHLEELPFEVQSMLYLHLKNKFENLSAMVNTEGLLANRLYDTTLNKHICRTLGSARLYTIRDLTEASRERLLGIRGFGKWSFQQVEEFLARMGLATK